MLLYIFDIFLSQDCWTDKKYCLKNSMLRSLNFLKWSFDQVKESLNKWLIYNKNWLDNNLGSLHNSLLNNRLKSKISHQNCYFFYYFQLFSFFKYKFVCYHRNITMINQSHYIEKIFLSSQHKLLIFLIYEYITRSSNFSYIGWMDCVKQLKSHKFYEKIINRKK